ncbi:MAG: lipopolysaccharide heptosyltransferase II [Phycisphaeraceae bacterium]
MSTAAPTQPIHRLLVVYPTWLGDCVMAMPTLRALRERFPEAHITVLVGRPLRAIVAPNPWMDRIVTHKLGGGDRRHTLRRLVQRLRRGRFDAAVLLPNSFRAALLVRLAGIPRRIGYDRDGRGLLLTDRLLPQRAGGRYVKVPTREYYLGLARYLGATRIDPRMQLFTRPADDADADALLARAGWSGESDNPLLLLNPGANYGDAKMWPPARFAAVADRAHREWNATVAVSGAPKERPILDQLIAAAKAPILDLPAHGLQLRLLKSIVRRASLMITNDTGPRHIAAALDTPVVTVFGPTDPKWTEIGFARERQVMLDVECGPCQLKKCPLDHRCMNWLPPDMVFEQAAELLPPREAPV